MRARGNRSWKDVSGGRIDPDEQDRITAICLRDTCLLDWDHLEDEAAARGLNYIYNVVPASHPDRRQREVVVEEDAERGLQMNRVLIEPGHGPALVLGHACQRCPGAGPMVPCSSTAASTIRCRVCACCSARFLRV